MVGEIYFNVKLDYSPKKLLTLLINKDAGYKETNIFLPEFDNVPIFQNSHRYILFNKNPRCVKCGREIKYAVFKGNARRGHINFFSEDGVLMTKDHIKPKSKGGKDNLNNMQTMCEICNSNKGNKYKKNPKKKKA